MDDDETIRLLARITLRRLGYGLEEAGTVDEAVARYRRALEGGEKFVAVILDLSIPGGRGGTEAVRLLRELDPDVKAFVSSGNSEDPAIRDPRRFGFRGVLAKPFTYEDVAAALGPADAVS